MTSGKAQGALRLCAKRHHDRSSGSRNMAETVDPDWDVRFSGFSERHGSPFRHLNRHRLPTVRRTVMIHGSMERYLTDASNSITSEPVRPRVLEFRLFWWAFKLRTKPELQFNIKSRKGFQMKAQGALHSCAKRQHDRSSGSRNMAKTVDPEWGVRFSGFSERHGSPFRHLNRHRLPTVRRTVMIHGSMERYLTDASNSITSEPVRPRVLEFWSFWRAFKLRTKPELQFNIKSRKGIQMKAHGALR